MSKTTRREFLRTAGLGAAALGASRWTSPASAKTPSERPNFVFILADDWGWGDLGCYGHDLLRTPNLDRLAADGTLFTQFYVNGPVCSPTRAGIMTGQFPGRHKVFGHFDVKLDQKRGMPSWLDPSVVTITRLLKQQGYVTGHFGKWHLGNGRVEGVDAPAPSAYGVDDSRTFVSRIHGWDMPDFDSRSSELIVDEAIRFVEANREKPFYVNVWLKDVHAMLDPTEEQMAAYPNLKGATRVYYSAATNADRQLGRLFAKLDELGLRENTVVIFTSDNGPEDIHIPSAAHSGVGTAGPFRGRKRSLYEGGVRTPFIVRWPKGTPAKRVDNQTVLSGVDMLPSLCALAGVGVPGNLKLDGRDMSAALKGSSVRRDKPLMWEFRYPVAGDLINRSPMLAIRDGDWKLLTNPDRSRVELYDIPRDPSELNNQADRRPAEVKRLSRSLLEWFKSLPGGPIEPAAGKADYKWPGR
jgi:N-acetylgalactosamine-6-sulfatase